MGFRWAGVFDDAEWRMNWAVVGGGVLGCTLAKELRARGHQVTLYEGGFELGGLAAPWQLGHGESAVQWDRHYHVTLLSDRRTNALYDSLGLSDGVRWVETKTGYYGTDHVLRSVSNSVEFLKLPGLSLLDKGRLGGTILYGSRVRNGVRMEGITVERWLRRWSGKRTFDTFWKPLLRAKLGDQYTHASAAFIWATIQRLYAARRTGLKKEMFGYVGGGYRRVFEAFGEWFDEHGVAVRLGAPVQSVGISGSGLRVTTSAGDEQHDRVVVTTSAPLAASMCPELLPGEQRRLNDVRYIGIVCASMLLRRKLADYYLAYITDPATPCTAVVEMTSFIDPSEVGGHSLVYLPKYTVPDDPMFDLTDDEIRDQFLPFIRSMYPDFRDDDVIDFKVSRVRRVFAVPTLDYSGSVPSISTSIPGLYLAGSANLPFATLNVDDTLSLVDEVLRLSGDEPRQDAA
jgi:protoporphyrinogen oxidase